MADEERIAEQIKLREVCSDCGKVKPPKAKNSLAKLVFGDAYLAAEKRWVAHCQCSTITLNKLIGRVPSTPSQTEAQLKEQRKFQSHKAAFDAFAQKVSEAAGDWQSRQYGKDFEGHSIKEQVGLGSMGALYRAIRTSDQKLFAAKVIRPELTKNKRIVKRIQQAAESARNLHHPNIAAVYMHGIMDDGAPIIISEFVAGRSLEQRIKDEGFFDVPEALDIAIQTCEAMEYAHAQGVTHQGVKPSNIIISESGSAPIVKVVDYGLAKALPSAGAEASNLTQTTNVFGDARCMSPEQCMGARLDHRSDIYSLGCTLYECLTGKSVFKSGTPVQAVMHHLTATPQPFSKVMYNCDIPLYVEQVVLTMLEKDPNLRYQSFSALRSDLERVRDGKKPAFSPLRSEQKRPGYRSPPTANQINQKNPATEYDHDLANRKSIASIYASSDEVATRRTLLISGLIMLTVAAILLIHMIFEAPTGVQRSYRAVQPEPESNSSDQWQSVPPRTHKPADPPGGHIVYPVHDLRDKW